MAGDSTRPYRGPIKAVILDWAGTVVDYGSRAPAETFVELFRRSGLTITIEDARGAMGSHKRDHVAQLLALPHVASAWRELHGRDVTEADIDATYETFIPLQIEALPRFADLIPGTPKAIRELRKRGCRIGTTTGYNRQMMDVLVAQASRRGFQPDCVVTSDDVPGGRPYPWMALRNMIELEVYPSESCVKVGDTVADVLEGLNAGMWTVAVAKTGNELGLSEPEVKALAPDDLAARLETARERLSAAGAHYVIDGIADLPAVLDEIEEQLASGVRP